MSASDQRDFFRSSELSYWAEADGLKDEEAALIGAWLDPAASTVDAGTGGGRIPRGMDELGFAELTGFDFAPELVEAARAAPGVDAITFDLADATKLPYPDCAFAQATYLQQVICTIDDEGGRRDALREAVRILAPGGIALFSFVCWESRRASRGQRAYVAYLRALRRLKGDRRPIQSMPRLRLSGRADPGALRDRGPFNWWYRAEEAQVALEAAGFAVVAIGFGPDAEGSTLASSAGEAIARGAGGTLYAVCRKPAA